MGFFILGCFLICPSTFIWYLFKSIYQVIRQARDNPSDQSLQFTGSMFMACLLMTLSIISVMLFIATEF